MHAVNENQLAESKGNGRDRRRERGVDEGVDGVRLILVLSDVTE